MQLSEFTTRKLIEYSYLTIAWFSAIACLYRTDYNFTVALFGYYFWSTRSNSEKLKPLLYLTGLMIAIDIIWLITVGYNWSVKSDVYPEWNQNRGIRLTAFLFSIFNVFTKLMLAGFLFLFSRNQNQGTDSQALLTNQKQKGFNLINNY